MEDPPIKVMLELDRDNFSILDFLFRVLDFSPKTSSLDHYDYMNVFGKLYNLYSVYKQFNYDKKIVAAIENPSLFPEVLHCHFAFYPAYIFFARSFAPAFNLLVKNISENSEFGSIVYSLFDMHDFDMLYTLKFPLIQNVIYTKALNKYIRTLESSKTKNIAKKAYDSMKRVQRTFIELLEETNIQHLNSEYFTVDYLIKVANRGYTDVTPYVKSLSEKMSEIKRRGLVLIKEDQLKTWAEQVNPSIESKEEIMAGIKDILNFKHFRVRSLGPFLEKCVYPVDHSKVIKECEEIIPDISLEQIQANINFYIVSDYYTNAGNIKRIQHADKLKDAKQSQKLQKLQARNGKNPASESLNLSKADSLKYNFLNETITLTRDFFDVRGNIKLPKDQKARKEQQEKILAHLRRLRKRYERGYDVHGSEAKEDAFYMANYARIVDLKWNNDDLKDISFLLWRCKNCLSFSLDEIVMCEFCELEGSQWMIQKFHVNYRTLGDFFIRAERSLVKLSRKLIDISEKNKEANDHLRAKDFEIKRVSEQSNEKISELKNTISEEKKKAHAVSVQRNEASAELLAEKENGDGLQRELEEERKARSEEQTHQKQLLCAAEEKCKGVEKQLSVIAKDRRDVCEELNKSASEMTNIIDSYSKLKAKTCKLEGDLLKVKANALSLKEENTSQAKKLETQNKLLFKQRSALEKKEKNLRTTIGDVEKLLDHVEKLTEENKSIKASLSEKEKTKADLAKRHESEKKSVLEERRRTLTALQKERDLLQKKESVALSKLNIEKSYIGKLRAKLDRLVLENSCIKETTHKLSMEFLRTKSLLEKRKTDSELSIKEIIAIKRRKMNVMVCLQFLVLLVLLLGFFNIFPFSEEEEWVNFASSVGMWKFMS